MKRMLVFVLIFSLCIVNFTSTAEAISRKEDFSYVGSWTSSKDTSRRIGYYWDVYVQPPKNSNSDYYLEIWSNGTDEGGYWAGGDIRHIEGKQVLSDHIFEDYNTMYVELVDNKIVVSGEEFFTTSMGNVVDFDIHDPTTYKRIERDYTFNESKLKLTNWSATDVSHVVHYTITNEQMPRENGYLDDIIDTSYYAIIFFGQGVGRSEVNFLETKELSSGESISGFFYTQFNGKYILNNDLTGIIVKFRNEADKERFKEGIPMAKSESHWDNNQIADGYYDDATEAKKWFKDNFNIDY